MTSLETLLEHIGLSKKEAKVYVACLKFPNQATSTIAKKTTMNRGTTFVILHELLKKGLVKKSISSNVQRFSAVSPKDLITFLEKKEFILKKQKEKIKDAIPRFRNIQGLETKKPLFQFYEGKNGLQNLLSEMHLHKNTQIKSILSPSFLHSSIDEDFAQEFESRRLKNNNSFRILLSLQEPKDTRFTTSRKSLREARYMPDPLSFPMTTFLFKDTAILLSHKDNFGLSIQSSEFVHMQEVFFDTIWAISKSHIPKKAFRMPIV